MSNLELVDILAVDDELKEKVREWRNKEEVRKYMLTQHIITEEEHSKWIKNLRHKNDYKGWVVFVDNTPIGLVYLQNMNHGELTSEWGVYIGEDAYRGKGLSKCILFKLLEMFFDEMKFKTLSTKLLSKNIVALDLYKKFKFREIDKLPFEGKEKIILLKFSKEDWVKFKKSLRDECYSANRE